MDEFERYAEQDEGWCAVIAICVSPERTSLGCAEPLDPQMDCGEALQRAEEALVLLQRDFPTPGGVYNVWVVPLGWVHAAQALGLCVNGLLMELFERSKPVASFVQGFGETAEA